MSQRVIRIRNDLAEIPRACAEAIELLDSKMLGLHFIRTVSLGLEEVTSNIIKYGYNDEREHWIQITLNLTELELEIAVADGGREFNPLQLPEPDRTEPLSEREPGGLGVSFLRRLFDEVQYRREAQRNLLILRKRLPEPISQ